jgi:hypothetical protein
MRKRKADWVPWYRERKYKGNLTEAEKRQLDAFRTQPKHAAASSDDLPEEVQSYLSGIEMELYDKKQEGVAARAFLYSAIGAGLPAYAPVNPLGWFVFAETPIEEEPSYVGQFQRHELAFHILPEDGIRPHGPGSSFFPRGPKHLSGTLQCVCPPFRLPLHGRGLGLAAASGGVATSGSRSSTTFCAKSNAKSS